MLMRKKRVKKIGNYLKFAVIMKDKNSMAPSTPAVQNVSTLCARNETKLTN